MTVKENQNRAKHPEYSNYTFSITGRNIHVTESMKQYVMEKIAKIERFSPRAIDAVVTMDIQRFQHHVTIILRFDHVKVKAEATTEDMYTSIDVAVQRIESQLSKYRDKLHAHHQKALGVTDMVVHVLGRAKDHSVEETEEINDEIEEENLRVATEQMKPSQIVTTEVRPLRTLTFDEAIMKMELSQDAFMVFKHEEDMKIKIIYRRTDGSFGIIDPK